MKKLTAITISCALAAAVLLGSGGIPAFADEAVSNGTVTDGATFYPEAFEADVITDYAVAGDHFAYAANKKIAVYGGDKPVYYEFGVEIAALDLYDGEFCYKTAGGIVYDLNGNTLDYKITETELPVAIGGYSYTIKPDKTIKTTDKDGLDEIIDGEFRKLKVYGGVVYAINGNVLNKITPPATAEPINYELADFSSTEKIVIGNTVKALDTCNLEKPLFTSLKDGEYLTEVRLDAKNFDKTKVKATDYFAVGRTFKVGEENGFTAETSALVLCETGNAHIITVNGKTYIKLASTVSARDLSEPDFVSAQINVPADYVYSSRSLRRDKAVFRQLG